MAGRPQPAGRDEGRPLALAVSALTLLTVAGGLAIKAATDKLGTPLPPLFATWDPALGQDWALAIVVFVAAAAAATALTRPVVPTAPFLVLITGLALVARLALAAAGRGTSSWSSVYGLDPEAANEYLPALPALDPGVGVFLDRFAEVAPTLPIHPSAHPPGMLLLLDGLAISTPTANATLTIGIGVLAVPLAFALARRVGLDEGRARIATLLTALSPAAMIYGVTSHDALFATLGMVAAVLLVGSGALGRVAGAAALTLASFFSWALLAVGAFAAALAVLRNGIADGLRLATLCGAIVVGAYAALFGVTGFDPLGTLAAASEVYELGIAQARPWVYWVFGSPAAFLIATGLPISWYALRAAGARHPVALSLAMIVVVAALLGFSKAETERIWMFMGPLAAVAAATAIPRDRVPLVAALLVAQALATELLLDTVW